LDWVERLQSWLVNINITWTQINWTTPISIQSIQILTIARNLSDAMIKAVTSEQKQQKFATGCVNKLKDGKRNAGHPTSFNPNKL